MTTPAVGSVTLNKQQQDLLSSSLRDLARGLAETSEQMATSRNATAYLQDRSFKTQNGLANIYYHYLCVVSCDPTQAKKLLQEKGQIQKDVELLEKIRTAHAEEREALIGQAIRSKLSKETLKRLFSPLPLLFPKASLQELVEAIDRVKTVEIKVEAVAQPEIRPPAAQPANQSATTAVLPPTAAPAPAVIEDDEAFARRLQEEEDARGTVNERIDHKRRAGELDENALEPDDVTAHDEEFARRLQEEENLLAQAQEHDRQAKRARTDQAPDVGQVFEDDEALAWRLQTEDQG